MKVYNSILKVTLLAAAFGWGISAVGIFLPWTVAVEQLYALGGNIPDDPMLNYWFRMTACGFTYIAVQFAYMAMHPQKSFTQIKIAGIFNVLLGAVLLTYGIKLKLFILPYIVDSLFCLSIGIILLLCTFQLTKKKTEV